MLDDRISEIEAIVEGDRPIDETTYREDREIDPNVPPRQSRRGVENCPRGQAAQI